MTSGDRNTIRFLIVGSSPETGESFLNVFREAGYSTRATQINSVDDLSDAQSGRKSWDILLMAESGDSNSYTQLFDFVDGNKLDLPVIIMVPPDEEMDPLTVIKMGARGVVPLGNNEYLLTVVLRELENLKVRRQYRRMSVALHESEKQRRVLLDDQIDPVVYVNHGIVRYANIAFLNLVGLPDDDSVEGKLFRDFLNTKDQHETEEFLQNVEKSGQPLAVIQCTLMDKNGSEVPVSSVISPTSFNGEFTLSLMIKQSLEQDGKKSVDTTLAKSARDAETGLFDLKIFEQKLYIAIQKAVEGKGNSILCCLYLETLKTVHEEHGKEVSRKLLKEVAQIITTYLGDECYVSSMGGANFAVLISKGEEQPVKELFAGLQSAVAQQTVVIDQDDFSIKLSMGAVLINDTISELKTVFVQSRQAALIAQKKDDGQLFIYTKRKVNSVSSVRKQLASLVSQALKNKKFKLRYQPVVSLEGSSSEFYEVSFVFTDAEGKEHEAAKFRRQLEKVSLWNRIDRWQLIEASKELINKRKEGVDTRLLIHIGGFSTTDETFLPWMKVALKTAGIPTKAVAIELSEQNLIRYSEFIPNFFKSLKEMGCQTVVSEFGCSINPLDGIADLDIDLIKLDPSFVEGLSNDNNVQEMKTMIQGISKSGRKVIVPSIHTEEDLSSVWQYGADFIQGNYMQPPTQRMEFDFGLEDN